MPLILDIYLKASVPTPHATCVTLDVYRSWDGTLYGECNIVEACGPRRLVSLTREAVHAGGEWFYMNCGIVIPK